MSAVGLLIRGDEGDVAVADGRIVAVGPELAGPAAEEIDARGLLVLPGVVDAHVHLNDPGARRLGGVRHRPRRAGRRRDDLRDRHVVVLPPSLAALLGQGIEGSESRRLRRNRRRGRARG
jgi:cytosine/adenosine deaminase-related metal-dependent hydrolase